MRRKWDHISPSECQPEPADNTTPYIREQVKVWADSGGQQIVHPEIAMEIAAWYHSPATSDRAITAFASTGTIFDTLADDIARQMSEVASGAEQGPGDIQALAALAAYVKACNPISIVYTNLSDEFAAALAGRVGPTDVYDVQLSPDDIVSLIYIAQMGTEDSTLDEDTYDFCRITLKALAARYAVRISPEA